MFFNAGLPLQAALQVVYVAMSVYGWLAWNRNLPRRRPQLARRAPSRRLQALASRRPRPPARRALRACGGPVADSLGTWASLVATWLLARRIADNWLWWIVIDAGLAALFASRDSR